MYQCIRIRIAAYNLVQQGDVARCNLVIKSNKISLDVFGALSQTVLSGPVPGFSQHPGRQVHSHCRTCSALQQSLVEISYTASDLEHLDIAVTSRLQAF